MTTSELVDFVAASNRITKTQAKVIIDSVFVGIQTGLEIDGKAKMGPPGTLNVRFSKGYSRKHPVTGEETEVLSGNKIYFRASRKLRQAVQPEN